MRLRVGVAFVAALLLGGGHVIAADGDSDHVSAAAAAGAGEPESTAALTVAIVAALASVGVILLALRRHWFLLPPPGAPDRPTSPNANELAAWLIGAFLLQILVPAVPVVALQGVIAADTIAGRATLQWLAYLVQIPLAIIIVARIRPAFATPLRTAAIGLLGLACAIPLIVTGSQIASFLQTWWTGEPPTALAHDTLRMLIERGGDPWAWAVIAAVTIGAPILEEIAYRGGLQGAMRALGIGPWAAITLTSVFFAIMHLGAIPPASRAGAMTGLAILSISLGLLRERTGGLVAPIVAHAMFNVANLLVAWVFAGE